MPVVGGNPVSRSTARTVFTFHLSEGATADARYWAVNGKNLESAVATAYLQHLPMPYDGRLVRVSGTPQGGTPGDTTVQLYYHATGGAPASTRGTAPTLDLGTSNTSDSVDFPPDNLFYRDENISLLFDPAANWINCSFTVEVEFFLES